MNRPFGGLRQIAELMHEDDPRCVAYLYHAVNAAAHDLGLYRKRKVYSIDETSDIMIRADRLFPRRDQDDRWTVLSVPSIPCGDVVCGSGRKCPLRRSCNAPFKTR